tara:strand:+ start:105707 stop:106858 length:1152 start_codon:yes stop_codon:yes gene_type:complete
MENQIKKFKLDYDNTEHLALVRAMGSKDKTVARQAQEIFAKFVGPVVSKLLSVQGTSSLIYTDLPFDEDGDPSFPLDLYYGTDDRHVSVWSQTMAGGLPTSEVRGMNEMKFSTYNLYSAVSFLSKYARQARLDVVGGAVNRMAQEILLTQERNAWLVVLKALADASSSDSFTNSTFDHIIQSRTESVFVLDDLSRLITLVKRINASWAGGSTDDFNSRGVTDIFVSPEITEQIRGFVYNPMNVNNPAGGSAGATQDGIALDDTTRREIFTAGGRQELFGINIIDLNEFGTQRRYNSLFAEFAGNVAHSGTAFSTNDDEIIVGLDLTRDAFVRPVERDGETGSTFNASIDNQFDVERRGKMGFWGSISEGRIGLDSRSVCGLVV